MDSIGDVLYFIFIAIVAIASLFSGKKKKQAQQQGKPVVIMEENFPSIPMEPHIKEKVKKAKGNKKTQTPSPFLSGESSIERKDYKTAKKYQPTAEYAISNAEGSDSREFQLETMEDVRKGIVYSEILNRKY